MAPASAPVTTYTFSNVQANHTISATFQTVGVTNFTITASAGANGSISPSGAVTASQGASPSFTITPDSGFAVASVTVDGASVGAVTTYTFSNVQANHTISATFAAVSGSPILLEAESLSPVGGGATVSISNDANASGGVVEFLNATAANQTMTLTTPSIPAGTYQVQFRYKTNTSRGHHTITIDGSQVGGTIDQYATTSAYQTATLGSVTLGAGTHSIVLTETGKDTAATQFYITADSFIFTPTSGGGGQVAAPVFTPGGGTYTTAQNVSISSATSAVSIRYTTDGITMPTETIGTIYSGPVNISSTTTLKAIAYKSGMTDSAVTSEAYTITTTTPPPTFNFEAESLSPVGTSATDRRRHPSAAPVAGGGVPQRHRRRPVDDLDHPGNAGRHLSGAAALQA